MKKFICSLLTTCMILGVFSGCHKDYHESTLVSPIVTTETDMKITTAATAEVPMESEPAEATGTPGVVRDIANADAVNVRENAGGTYKVVTQIEEGTEIVVYEIVTINGKEWGRIDQGWILMDFVQLNGSIPATNPT